MKQINYSTSFVQFLQKGETKISRLLYSAYHNTRYDYRYKVFDLLLNDSEIDYLTFRNNGNISYLPKGKKHVVNENGEWSRENRQEGKSAKIIKKLFTAKALKLFKDKDFELFSNTYKSEFSSEGFKLELLDNKQIPKVYDMDRCNGEGSLQGSCMNNDIEYLDIYKHCDKLSILILTDKDGLLCGRSLIWDIDENTKLMDRIYVTHDWQYEYFISYAVKNKFWHKQYYKTYDNKSLFIDNIGEKQEKTFKIFTNTDYSAYPYIDTFSYGDDGFLTNTCNYSTYTYNNTDGTRDGEEDDHANEIYDDIEDEYIDEDDAIQIERGDKRGFYTHVRNTIEINGLTWWKDDDEITYVSSREDYYHIDDTVYCDSEGETYHIEDVVFINDEYYPSDSDDIIEVNDTWYLKDSEDIILIDGEYYEKTSDEIIEDENGNFSLKMEIEIDN